MRRGGPGLMLIAMSGYSSPETKVRAQLEGFDEFWVKPVELSALLERLAVQAPTDAPAVSATN